MEATTQYVDQGYSAGDSDGSRERPWTTVQAGVHAAEDGAIVAVAEGRYIEDVLIEVRSVRLWGRCPARTVVVGQSGQVPAILIEDEGGSGSEVRGLAVTGPGAGVVVQRARAVVLDALWVHDAANAGVAAIKGASVSLGDALLERNAVFGVFVEGSAVAVDATVVRATQYDATGARGRGIQVQDDAARGERGKLVLSSSLIERNHEIGLGVIGSDATVDATVVRATQLNASGITGLGIAVHLRPETRQRAQLALTSSLIEQNHTIGVVIEGSDATVDSTVVRATQPDGTGARGRGIDLEMSWRTGDRGRLALTSSLIEENHELGVFAIGSDATVDASVVRGTQLDAAGRFGRGIDVQRDPETDQSGNLVLTSSRVEDNHSIGVYVLGSAATIESTVVRATHPNRMLDGGRGINVQAGPDRDHVGHLVLASSLVEECAQIGVFVMGSDATVESTIVRGIQPDGAGTGGRGFSIQAEPAGRLRGQLALRSTLVEQNHDVGVYVSSSDATIDAAVVRGTRQAQANADSGDGILVSDSPDQAQAIITGTVVADNARVGVLYVGSSGELSRVRASNNRFGLVLQSGKSGAKPMLLEDNEFAGNAEQDTLSDGDLPIPIDALRVP